MLYPGFLRGYLAGKVNMPSSIYLNTIANFIGLGYSIIIAIIILPAYLQYLGAEAFGLFGFFLSLQAWMQFLDMGMSPLLSRQVALAQGNRVESIKLKKILRSLEIILLFLSFCILVVTITNRAWIANQWLNVVTLDLKKVTLSIGLMGSIIGPGLFTSLYRSGIRGAERQALLNTITIAVSSIRFIGAFFILKFVSRDIVLFFVYQAIISIAEAIAHGYLFYKITPPPLEEKEAYIFSWSSVRPMLIFAAGAAYTAGLWSLLMQVDKLALSKVLPLSEYGYYVLVGTIATGIIQISGPISQAVLPRMTYLISQKKKQDMITLYRMSSQYMAVLVFPIAGMIASFSHELVWVWTGDRVAAQWAGPVLTWFALGNAVLTISAFQYYLQFAYGDLRVHVISSSVTAPIEIAVIIFFAFNYGALAVSLIWFTMKLLSFFIFSAIIHRKFLKGMHLSWLFNDIAPFFLSTSIFIFLFRMLDIDFFPLERVKVFILLIVMGLMILSSNLIFSKYARKFLWEKTLSLMQYNRI